MDISFSTLGVGGSGEGGEGGGKRGSGFGCGDGLLGGGKGRSRWFKVGRPLSYVA